MGRAWHGWDWEGDGRRQGELPGESREAGPTASMATGQSAKMDGRATPGDPEPTEQSVQAGGGVREAGPWPFEPVESGVPVGRPAELSASSGWTGLGPGSKLIREGWERAARDTRRSPSKRDPAKEEGLLSPMKVTNGLATNGEQEKLRNGDLRCGRLCLRVLLQNARPSGDVPSTWSHPTLSGGPYCPSAPCAPLQFVLGCGCPSCRQGCRPSQTTVGPRTGFQEGSGRADCHDPHSPRGWRDSQRR